MHSQKFITSVRSKPVIGAKDENVAHLYNIRHTPLPLGVERGFMTDWDQQLNIIQTFIHHLHTAGQSIHSLSWIIIETRRGKYQLTDIWMVSLSRCQPRCCITSRMSRHLQTSVIRLSNSRQLLASPPLSPLTHILLSERPDLWNTENSSRELEAGQSHLWGLPGSWWPSHHYSVRDLNPLTPVQPMFHLNEVTEGPTTSSPTVISKGR